MPLTITPSGGSATTFLDPVDSFKDTVGNYYLISGMVQDAQYAIETSSAPNTDGFVVTRHGFRGRDVEGIEVIYIGASKAACLTAYTADHANMKNAQCSLVIPNDATYPSCEVVRFRKSGVPKDMANGKFRLHATIELKQMRLV